ncbi:hypothetical protein PC128_g5621 [Phytophthora cactorum]|nr:hypothetical protein PC128_g5621 [Phytophthora cactorum]
MPREIHARTQIRSNHHPAPKYGQSFATVHTKENLRSQPIRGSSTVADTVSKGDVPAFAPLFNSSAIAPPTNSSGFTPLNNSVSFSAVFNSRAITAYSPSSAQ